jgi:hypothetical protein
MMAAIATASPRLGMQEVLMSSARKTILAFFLVAAVAPALGAAPAARPDFSPHSGVGWIALSNAFIAPPSGAGPVRHDPAFPRVTNEEYRQTGRQPTLPVADLSNPILQNWTREALRQRNAQVQSGVNGLSRQASCWPVGVPGFNLYVVHPIFIIQAPQEVVMVWQGDHQVRRIRLTDRHAPDVKPSWFGDSIGHYEGDTLVVDTIGISTKTYVDNFYTPHSERLHVVERYRLIDGGAMLEARIHVEDPGAFTRPWDAIQRYRRVEPEKAENNVPLTGLSSSAAAGPLFEMSCAENPFSYFGDKSVPIPQADRPDF